MEEKTLEGTYEDGSFYRMAPITKDGFVGLRLPTSVLEAVDEVAREAGLSRSEVIDDGILRTLKAHGYHVGGRREYYTAQEAADALNIAVRAIRSYCSSGELPCMKEGTAYRIAPADLRRFEEKLTREGRHRRGVKRRRSEEGA